MSKMLLRAVYAVQPMYYGHIETIHSVRTIRAYLIIQVSLQVHAKAHFGSITKCVDYVGDLIFKYPD